MEFSVFDLGLEGQTGALGDVRQLWRRCSRDRWKGCWGWDHASGAREAMSDEARDKGRAWHGANMRGEQRL